MTLLTVFQQNLAAIGGILASASITEANDTLVSAGSLTIRGAATITEANDTLAASGVSAANPVFGVLAVTEADDALIATALAPYVPSPTNAARVNFNAFRAPGIGTSIRVARRFRG